MGMLVSDANLWGTIWLVGWFVTTVGVACSETESCNTRDLPSVSELVGRNVFSTSLLVWTVTSYLMVRIAMLTLWISNVSDLPLHKATLVFDGIRLIGLLMLAMVTLQLNETIHNVGAYSAGAASVGKGLLRVYDEEHGYAKSLHLIFVLFLGGLLIWFHETGNGWVEVVALLCICLENLFDGYDYRTYQFEIKVFKQPVVTMIGQPMRIIRSYRRV